MAKGQQTTRIDDLSPEQLKAVHERLEREVAKLQQSAQVLSRTATQYHQSENAVKELKQMEEGQHMLVPLTESLFVSGAVHEKEKVLVDIGTGYFAEKSCDDAVDFCQRRVEWIKEQIDSLGEELQSKQNAIQQISSVFNSKVQQAQQAQAQQAASSSKASGK